MLGLATGLMWASFALALSPEPVSLEVELDRSVDATPLVVKLHFSEPVIALDFSDTPYAFVSQDWDLLQEEALLNHSTLAIELKEPQKQLNFAVARANDDFIRGFYTPFLNFSDGGVAVFVGHYIPKGIKTQAGWRSSDDMEISLTIKAQVKANSLFSGQRNVAGYKMISGESRQYAYIGTGTLEDMGSFNIVFDPKLPAWIRTAYSEDGAKIFQQFESKTRTHLPFKPLLLVNFNDDDVAPRFDGGAISKQVAINFVGKGWMENPQGNKLSILRLWAHEAAHLWNAQYWKAEGRGAVWLTEGGANFLARAVLFDLGYLSEEQYMAQSEEQVARCRELLKEATLDELRNRADKYICGEAVFYLAISKQGPEYDAFDFWSAIVNSANGSTYTVEDFIAALEQSDITEPEHASLVNVATSVPGSMLDTKGAR